MKLLTFKLKYAEKKWQLYLEEKFGKETAEKFSVESNATAKTNEATINLLNFDGNSKIIKTVKEDNNVISAFIIDNYEVKKVIV
ncbi:MAG: hypothetical protein L3J35_02075 [Bacteroidales bacterium]|nr:hypothetical protein [Bacteroidales bacterium]